MVGVRQNRTQYLPSGRETHRFKYAVAEVARCVRPAGAVCAVPLQTLQLLVYDEALWCVGASVHVGRQWRCGEQVTAAHYQPAAMPSRSVV